MIIEHDNDKIETVNVTDGTKSTDYLKYKGVYYSEGTPDDVIYSLQRAREDHSRIRIWLGYLTDGLAWNEENDVIGYVGTTTGRIKSPILVYKQTSYGGGLISTNHILRIDEIFYKTTLYQAKNFHTDKFYIRETPKDDAFYDVNYAFQLYTKLNDTLVVHAQGKTQDKMEKLRDFLTGNRYSK